MKGIVLSCTRRYAHITIDNVGTIPATASSKALEICVGDEVSCSEAGSEIRIDSVLPRRNELCRSYRGEKQCLIANLDLLLVVAAVGKLFNTLVIDRILTLAQTEQIPCLIVVNKIDLGTEEIEGMIEAYRSLGYEVLLTSAKQGLGIERLRESLAGERLKAAALVGPSGVGKSSLLNRLVPEAERRTAEVSERTGQGKQTTTQALGLLYHRENAAGLLLVDPPGVQNFGVSHLKKQQVADTFPEMLELRPECEYSDCAHIKEDRCAVKAAVESSRISGFRYQSYLHMISEIEDAKPY